VSFVMVVMRPTISHVRLKLYVFDMFTKFGDSHFSHSVNMVARNKTENGSSDPDHTILGWSVNVS